jgi:hypothetical protein
MAATFYIQAIEKKETEVKLNIYIIHPDENYFPEKKNFALQIIWQPANPSTGADYPIGRKISIDQILDPDWMNVHTISFIVDVKITATENYPAADDFDYGKPMANLELLPKATFEITVTAPEWIEHIAPEQTWKSAAYDMGGA